MVSHLGLTKNMMAKAAAVAPAVREHIAKAIQAGVKIAYGTDPPAIPHGQNAHQFASLVALGMTPLQVIQAATVNAADLMAWSDRVGVLEPGHYADIVAVTGNPLDDVRLLESISFVMKGGELVRNDSVVDGPIESRKGSRRTERTPKTLFEGTENRQGEVNHDCY
jgi:imidazolonepropionase-like amidohydrolase